MVGMNPFQHLYDECNAGDSAAKYERLPDFPTHIDLELTNSCNFRCLMCPTGNFSQTRPSGFMEWETFDTIVEQCEAHGTGLRFIGWGEPTLHPEIHRFIRRAHDACLLTHLNTNGSKMDDTMMRMLIYGGLDSIKFSFQGVDRASYEEMRNTDFFEELFHTIRRFHFIREAERISRPWIHVSTTITDEEVVSIDAFRRRFTPICDQLSVGRTIFDFMDLSAVRLRPHEVQRLGELAAKQSVNKVHPDCPEVYDKLSIHWDGSVHVCCNDFDNITHLGNVNETPITEIWRHPHMEHYRSGLADSQHDKLQMCIDCYDYMGTNKPGSQGT